MVGARGDGYGTCTPTPCEKRPPGNISFSRRVWPLPRRLSLYRTRAAPRASNGVPYACASIARSSRYLYLIPQTHHTPRERKRKRATWNIPWFVSSSRLARRSRPAPTTSIFASILAFAEVLVLLPETRLCLSMRLFMASSSSLILAVRSPPEGSLSAPLPNPPPELPSDPAADSITDKRTT